MRNALIHAIDSKSVLNQIVRADAEKIDVTGERSRTNRRARNFDHRADLHFGIEWDASRSQFAFAFIHHLEGTSQLGFSRNHRKHQFDIADLARAQNRPQLRFEDLRMFEAKPNGAQPQKRIEFVAHVDPAGDLVATEIERSNNQWMRPDRFGDAPISLVLLFFAGQ